MRATGNTIATDFQLGEGSPLHSQAPLGKSPYTGTGGWGAGIRGLPIPSPWGKLLATLLQIVLLATKSVPTVDTSH